MREAAEQTTHVNEQELSAIQIDKIDISWVVEKIKRPLKLASYTFLTNHYSGYKIPKNWQSENGVFYFNADGSVLYSEGDTLQQHLGALSQFIEATKSYPEFITWITEIISAAMDATDDLNEKKAIFNGCIFILNAVNFHDQKDLLNILLTAYPKEFFNFNISIDTIEDAGLFSNFFGYDNNVIKPLIYNEKWHSLLAIFSSGIARPATIHKDNKGKSDLAALIINQAPLQVIMQYLDFAEKILPDIDFFEKQDGYSLVEYMFIFGQNELLERLQGQINQQLQGNQAAHLQIYKLCQLPGKTILARANNILKQNGGDFLVKNIGTKSSIAAGLKHHITEPTDRKFGLDYSLWYSICLFDRNKDQLPSQVQDFLDKFVTVILQQGYNDQDFKQQLREISEQQKTFSYTILPDRFNPALDGNSSLVGSLYPKEMHNKSRGEICLEGFQACKTILPSIFKQAIEHIRKSDIDNLAALLKEEPRLCEFHDPDQNYLLHFCTNSYNITARAFNGDADQDSKTHDVLTRRFSIWQLLCANGSNPKILNEKGETPQDILIRINSKEIAEAKTAAEAEVIKINQSFATKLLANIEKAAESRAR